MSYSIARTEERVVGSNGKAIIQIGPKTVAEKWTINTLSTETTSQNSQYTPKVEVKRNGSELVAGSWNANFDTATGEIKLNQNEFLRCELSNGEPGTTWTLSVDGRGSSIAIQK